MTYRLTGRLDGRSAIILSSPHSGTDIPPDFLLTCRLSPMALRRLEDAHIGRILAPAAGMQLPLIEATLARAVIDLNRAETEIDPQMFEQPLDLPSISTDKMRRGYGLFPRLVAGDPIHSRRLPAATASQLIETIHRPWHSALAEGLRAARQNHGHALLLDMHSMPRLDGPEPAALVIGDRHGQSAGNRLVNWLTAAFEAHGLTVARNRPYAGGHTTARHGRPDDGIHAIQLEFDRGLYMDPATLVPHQGLDRLARMIADVLAELRPALPLLLDDGVRLAAE